MKKGFTLIELLVVISIIALLLSIIVPSLGKAKETASMINCLSNQKSFATALHMYVQSNRGTTWRDISNDDNIKPEKITFYGNVV